MTHRYRCLLRASLFVAVLGLASGGPVLAQGAEAVGDAEAGRALAQRWCASCHMIDPGHGTAAATGVPTFAGIAGMPSTTALALRAFLRTPHQRMPDLHLTNQEIDDVSAYILGMRGR
jgi:mono/diheme cytochrome c family protein